MNEQLFSKFVKNAFLILVNVVDLAFISNLPGLMDHIKLCLHTTIDVELFDALISFTG